MTEQAAPTETPAAAAPAVAPAVAPAAASPGLVESFAASTNPAPAVAAAIEPAAAAAPAAPAATPAVAPAVSRPDGLSEDLWDATAGAPKWADIAARLTKGGELEAAETARAADVPADAAGYKLEVTGDPILGIDGKPVGFMADDPLAKAIVGVAAEHKLSQGQFSALTRAYAQSQVDMAKAMQASVQAETAKLGPTAEARVGAVVNFVRQHGKEAGDALLKGLWSADSVIALERVIALAGQPALGATQAQKAAPSIIESWFPKSMGKPKS